MAVIDVSRYPGYIQPRWRSDDDGIVPYNPSRRLDEALIFNHQPFLQ